MEFYKTLASYIRAGYQVLNVRTHEEPRLEEAIRKTVQYLGTDAGLDPVSSARWRECKLVRWDLADGAVVFDPTGRDAPNSHSGTSNPVAYLDKLFRLEYTNNHAVSIAKNFFDLTHENPMLRRRIQNAIHNNEFVQTRVVDGQKVRCILPLIVVSGEKPLHPDLVPLVPTLDFKLPDEAELTSSVEYILQSGRYTIEDTLKEVIVRNLRGLASVDAENALARALVLHGPTPELVGVLKEEKAKIARESGALTYISEEDLRNISPLGGFEAVLEHIELHALGFKKEAREAGIPYPKGIALAGPPGTGKSHLAKLVGKMLDMPTYFFDVASVFSSLVGSSEQNVKKALEIVEAQAGAVIVLDELDKAIGGVHKSNNDSGVGKRVVGKILTWLTERKSPTYVIATLNRIGDVPPEFLRAGRFDACFCTSLPDVNARKEIFKIHLQKRKCGDTLDMLRSAPHVATALMDATKDFVGSEIETVVEEAILRTYRDAGHIVPPPDTLLTVAREVKPLALTAGDDLAQQKAYMEQGWLRPVCKVEAREHTKRSRALG